MSEKSPQSFSPSHTPSLHESDEGGLNIGQFGSVLRRRSLLIIGITGAVAGGAVFKATTDPLVYQGKLEILTKSESPERKVTENIPQSVNIAPPESEQEINTTIRVLQSSRVLSSVIKTLKPKYPDLEYNSLLKNLEISAKEKEKNILTVKYSSQDKKQAEDVVNALAKTYLDYSLKERRADVEQAIEFVQARIHERNGLKAQVTAWQDKLATFRRVNNLVEPEKKATEVSTYITTLTQQQLENRVQLEQMVAQYRNLQAELAQQPTERAGNSVLSANTRYQKILDAIQEADIETKKIAALFTNENPSLKTLNDRKANLLPMLKAEEQRVLRDFQSRIYELEAKDKSITQKIIFLNTYLKELATLSRDYNRIQEELKIANDNLNQFLAKRQALQIDLSQKQQPWQLLNIQDTPSNRLDVFPLEPKIKLYLGLGGMLGLLLGTGAALLVDKIHNVYYTAKDLRDTTTLPVLGVIPLVKELLTLGKENEISQAPIFFEVFRSLYTNILLLGSDSPIRSLVISSAIPGEGKSTVAIQLAQAAAAMGQRVLLVDANLRFPTLHKLAGSLNIQGLTDVIAHGLSWGNVVEKSRHEENLYIISAGQVPPDPIRLLASQKMQNLMHELQASFDLVIYDTPNLLGIADANLLAAHTNGMILVTELSKLKRTLFQEVLEELQISGTPMLGIVANKSKEDAASIYYRQYYKKKISVEKVETKAEMINR